MFAKRASARAAGCQSNFVAENSPRSQDLPLPSPSLRLLDKFASKYYPAVELEDSGIPPINFRVRRIHGNYSATAKWTRVLTRGNAALVPRGTLALVPK